MINKNLSLIMGNIGFNRNYYMFQKVKFVKFIAGYEKFNDNFA